MGVEPIPATRQIVPHHCKALHRSCFLSPDDGRGLGVGQKWAKNPTQLLHELGLVAIIGMCVDGQGSAWVKDSRPQLNRLMEAAKRREIDAEVCWKLGRFGRSLRRLVNALAEQEAVGVAFISLRALAAKFGTSVGTVQRCIKGQVASHPPGH